jgi:hypothetical protein
VRWAQLPEDTDADREQQLAEHAITITAVRALPELADEHGISEEVRERSARDYAEHLQLVEAHGSGQAAKPDGGVTSAAAGSAWPAPGARRRLRR